MRLLSPGARAAHGACALAPAVALLADRLVGDPVRAHPVAGFGAAALAAERRCWRDRYSAGVLHLLGTVLPVVIVLARLDRRLPPAGRALLLTTVTWAALGGRSLGRAAIAVADAVADDDLVSARAWLPALVGRDPSDLDATGLCRAALESVAENTADAVVAPLLASAVGPAAVAGHRAVNTLDAMVGHRSARYRRFGWAAARSDDLANLLPARLTVLCTALLAPTVGATPGAVLTVVGRDGAAHPSPNAGRCEAAFAGALGVRLGGENRYGATVERRGPHGDGPDPGPQDVRRAVTLSQRVGLAAALLALALRLAAGCARRRRAV